MINICFSFSAVTNINSWRVIKSALSNVVSLGSGKVRLNPGSCTTFMPRTHEANKSNLFAQILDELTLSEFAQINDVLFAHVYKAIDHNRKSWLICPLAWALMIWASYRGRLHELKEGLFSAQNLSYLLHTGTKLELKTGPVLRSCQGSLDGPCFKSWRR